MSHPAPDPAEPELPSASGAPVAAASDTSPAAAATTTPIPASDAAPAPPPPAAAAESTTPHTTTSLHYSLLGPSLTKAGQEAVDQARVSEVIYAASRGSKFFGREAARDRQLTDKIAALAAKRDRLEADPAALARHERAADALLEGLEAAERELGRVVVHLDCDAFYAAVEQLDRPELADVPFAVGGGVLTTCNYAARRFGCRSGMAGFVAKKLCPALVMLPLNFEKYNAKAREVREVLAEYDPRFESASIDEAYLDLTDYCMGRRGGARGEAVVDGEGRGEGGEGPREGDDADEAAPEAGGPADDGAMVIDPETAVQQLRAEVKRRTRITVSAGIACNARLAKICSNINKPDGQFCLPPTRASVMRFMRDLPVRKVNGVGRVFERELDEVLGIKTAGDVFGRRAFVAPLFGDKAAEFLARCYLGLGRTQIRPADEYERKSVGTESTFRELSAPAELRARLRRAAEELEKDLARAACRGRTLVLKVKLHTFEVYTRQVPTPKAVGGADELYDCALPVLDKLEAEMGGPGKLRLRLLGLRCTHLVSTKKPDAMAFFGMRPSPQQDEQQKQPEVDEDGWQIWTDEMPDSYDVEGPEREGEAEEGGEDDGGADKDGGSFEAMGDGEDWQSGPGGSERPADWAAEAPSPGAIAFRRHGKEILPNPVPLSQQQRQQKRDGTADAPQPGADDGLWDCPICGRAQPASARTFNAHIDLCLSRRAIVDTVRSANPTMTKDEAVEGRGHGGRDVAVLGAGGGSSSGGGGGGGRKRALTADDPRQTKLRFG